MEAMCREALKAPRSRVRLPTLVGSGRKRRSVRVNLSALRGTPSQSEPQQAMLQRLFHRPSPPDALGHGWHREEPTVAAVASPIRDGNLQERCDEKRALGRGPRVAA